MKKLLGMFVAIAGAGVVLWAGSSLLVTHKPIFGYDAVYPGLAGIALLVGGLIMRQD